MHATAHELQFVSEAEQSDSQMRNVPTDVGELIAAEPLVAAAMNELCDRWPASLTFGDLVAAASQRLAPAVPDAEAVDRPRGVPLEAYVLRVVWLSGCALPATGHRAAALRPVRSHEPRRPAAVR
jgi:hypothetical protein